MAVISNGCAAALPAEQEPKATAGTTNPDVHDMGTSGSAPSATRRLPPIEDVSSCGSAPSLPKEVSKPAPKANFTAPKVWMVVFGVVLAGCAGAVDVVAWRGLHVFVSHVSGTTARVGMRMEGLTTGMNEPWDMLHCVLLVCSFIFGSFLCGLFIPKNQVHFGAKSFYGVALLANSGLLITAGCIAPSDLESVTETRAVAAGCLAAMACGLQNAMCTMHFGAVVRTTHVTGTATDIGSTAGRAAMILLTHGCKHRNANAFERMELLDGAMKLFVLLPLFAGFLSGAVLGAFLHTKMGVQAFFMPAMITGTTGLVYAFFRTHMQWALKKFEERRLKDELSEMGTALQRAHDILETAGQSAGCEELGDLDGIIGESLRVVQNVEATISELCSKPAADARRAIRARTCPPMHAPSLLI